MLYEGPRAMLSRLRIGREEFCQRLITTLILAGTYPKWNLRSTPSSEGVGFLEELDRLSFGESRWAEGAVFVDEFELPPRVESEQGGYPDWAVIFPDRLWLIELKTERGSHRPGQLPYTSSSQPTTTHGSRSTLRTSPDHFRGRHRRLMSANGTPTSPGSKWFRSSTGGGLPPARKTLLPTSKHWVRSVAPSRRNGLPGARRSSALQCLS